MFLRTVPPLTTLAFTILIAPAAHADVPPALLDAARDAKVVLLGERHDHAGHHLMQEEAYRALIAAGHRPALVMEMFSRDAQPAIDALLAGLGTMPDQRALDLALERMPEVSGFTAGGWQDWAAYRPIVAVALEHGLPVRAADWPREARRALAMDGWQALPSGFVQHFALDEPAEPDVEDGLSRAIVEGHCGHAPGNALEGMVRVQRARDAGIAGAALDALAAAGVDQALVIAGAGHVRRDLGAPLYLKAAAPELPILTVGLAETGESDAAPDLRPARDEEPFDLVWVAEAQPREDPCKAFADQLRNMKRP